MYLGEVDGTIPDIFHKLLFVKYRVGGILFELFMFSLTFLIFLQRQEIVVLKRKVFYPKYFRQTGCSPESGDNRAKTVIFQNCVWTKV